MRDRTWPTVAKIVSGEPEVHAHSRGGMGVGGHYAYAVGGGAHWLWQPSIAAMCTADALKFRAFIHSLRGSSGTFTLPTPGVAEAVPPADYYGYSDDTLHSDDTPFSDLTLVNQPIAVYATAAAGSTALTLSVIRAHVVPGAFVLVTTASGSQLVRIVSITGTTLEIRPRLRAAVAIGASVAVGVVAAKWRLASQVPPVPLIQGRSLEMTLPLEEAY